MSKQAKAAPTIEELRDAHELEQVSKEHLKDQEMDLQMRFSKLSPDQRMAVGNYLNAYNLAAWIFNEIIDESCRTYIDLAMKYTMETNRLAQSMREVSEDPQEVEQIVNNINHGE